MKIYKAKIKIKFKLNRTKKNLDVFSEFSKFVIEYYSTLTPAFIRTKSFFKVIKSNYKKESEGFSVGIIEGELYNLKASSFAYAKSYITMVAVKKIKSNKYSNNYIEWDNVKIQNVSEKQFKNLQLDFQS